MWIMMYSLAPITHIGMEHWRILHMFLLTLPMSLIRRLWWQRPPMPIHMMTAMITAILYQRRVHLLWTIL